MNWNKRLGFADKEEDDWKNKNKNNWKRQNSCWMDL